MLGAQTPNSQQEQALLGRLGSSLVSAYGQLTVSRMPLMAGTIAVTGFSTTSAGLRAAPTTPSPPSPFVQVSNAPKSTTADSQTWRYSKCSNAWAAMYNVQELNQRMSHTGRMRSNKLARPTAQISHWRKTPSRPEHASCYMPCLLPWRLVV